MQKITAPCNNCPFRRDVHMRLSRSRVEGIVLPLLSDDHFICHKTARKHKKNRRVCFGSALFLQKNCGGVLGNKMYRLWLLNGVISLEDLERCQVEVYSSLEEMIANQDPG